MERRRDDARDIARRVSAGESILVSAPTGAGKTWLLLQVGEILAAQGARVLALHGSDATAAIPLGLFLSLPHTPRVGAHPGSDAAIFSAATQLRRQLLEGADVVIVDQAGSVDPASATVLYETARSGAAILLSEQSDPSPGSPFAVLVLSELATLMHLSPLHIHDVADIVSIICPGPIDRRALQAITDYADGNGFAAHQLCRGLIARGILRSAHGVWILDGPSTRVADLSGTPNLRVSTLSPPDRQVLEAIALTEMVPLEAAMRLWPASQLERMEEEGLIAVEGSTALSIRVADPFVREALLSELPVLRRRRLAGILLDSGRDERMAHTSSLVDRMSTIELKIDAGHPVPLDEGIQVTAAIEAVAPDRAERVLRTLTTRDDLEGRSTAELRLQLVRLLVRQNRMHEAALELDELGDCGDGDLAREIDLARIDLLSGMGANTREALELVERIRAAARAVQEEVDPRVDVLRARVLLRSGRVREARVSAEQLANRPRTPPVQRAASMVIACYAAIYLGDRATYSRLRKLLAVFDSDHEAAHLPDGPETLALLDAGAALMLGQSLHDAAALAKVGYRRTLGRGDDGIRGQFAAALGWNATLRGDPRAGFVLLREAQALPGAWTPASRPWIMALYVQALALAGELDSAKRQMAELSKTPGAPLYDLDIGIARAVLLMAVGSFDKARRTYLEVAARAIAADQRYLARIAYYGAARLGDPRSAGRLLPLMNGHDETSDSAIRRHAESILAADASALERAARDLEQADLGWYAADAWGVAAQLRQRQGDARGAIVAAERGASIERNGTLIDPVLRAVERPRLTPREAEVVGLVAEGRTDHQVAERLGLSPRTVHSHLRKSFSKLGIDSRSQLRALFDRGSEGP